MTFTPGPAPHAPLSPAPATGGLLGDLRTLTPSERRIWRAPLMWAAAVAILFIPVIYVALYLAGVWDPYGNLKQLPVALVNADVGTRYQGQRYTVGADLVRTLRADPPVKFTSYLSEAAAQAAVRRGEVYFALSIPADFSRKAVAGSSAEHGLLHLYSGEGTSYFASRVGSSVAKEVVTTLNARLGSTRWDKVQKALVTVQQGFSDLRTATLKLRDGADTLATGSAKLRAGSVTLAQSAAAAASGGHRLAQGTAQLSDGVGRLTGGVTQLAGAVTQLGAAAPGRAQLQPLQDGAAALKSGSANLAGGLGQVSGGAGALAASGKRLSAGAGAVADGAAQLAGSLPKLAGGAAALQQGAGELAAGTQALAGRLGQVSAGAGTLATSAEQLSAGAAQVAGGAKQLAGQLADPANGAAQAEQRAAGATTLATGSSQLQAGAVKLAGGAQTLSRKTGQAQAGATKLAAGATTLAQKTGDLGNATRQLASGAKTLASGSAQLAGGAAQLAGRAGTLAQKTAQAEVGAQQVASGAASLERGVGTLVTGNLRLKSALSTLQAKFPAPNDLAALKGGAGTLAGESGKLAAGLDKLSGGAAQLSQGAGDLNGGAVRLQGGLSALSARIPTGVQPLGGDPAGLSASVQVVSQTTASVASNGEAFAPYFVALSLWVGCTLTTFIFPYLLIPESGRRTGQVARVLRKFAVPAAYVVFQALIVVLGIHLQGVRFLHPWLVLLTSVAASLTFMLLVLALNLLLGAAGRLLALVLLVLQLAASGGSYPVELSSGFFQSIHAFIPVTDAINALRYALFGSYEGQYAGFMLRMGLVALLSVVGALLGRSRWQYIADERFRSPLITDVG
ncbi:YhgE/Pip family protein [Deinococcus sp.]|uniref:YhgE/Pip family protein n=1 Tax=Deinococcus sp. TaxID=47478 RepID=UPI003CC5A4E1